MNDNNDIFSLDDHTDNKLLIDETEVSDQPKSIRDVKKIFWANAIARCNKKRADSRITVGKWCIKNNLSIRSYWYYHKKIGDELANKARDIYRIFLFALTAVCFPFLNIVDYDHRYVEHDHPGPYLLSDEISSSGM